MFSKPSDQPIEDYAAPARRDICDPEPKPGALAFRQWVIDHFGERPGTPQNIRRACHIGGESAHHQGRAWDWFPPDKETGDAFVKCLTSPDDAGNPDAWARRVGLRVIIWQRRIWTSGTKDWRRYGGPNPHTDHVHFTLGLPGAAAATSFYTHPPVATSDALYEAAELGAIADERAAGDVVQLYAANGLADNTTPAFRRRLVEVARALGLDPSILAVVISFETAGTFRPDITAGGGTFDPDAPRAVGLIQFTQRYAPPMTGYTVHELAKMTATEQLEAVRRWYESIMRQRGRPKRPDDYYHAVFAPSGCYNRDGDRAVYVKPSAAYSQNWRMDTDGDGRITCSEIGAKFAGLVNAAERRGRVVVNMDGPVETTAAGALLIAAGLVAAGGVLACSH